MARAGRRCLAFLTGVQASVRRWRFVSRLPSIPVLKAGLTSRFSMTSGTRKRTEDPSAWRNCPLPDVIGGWLNLPLPWHHHQHQAGWVPAIVIHRLARLYQFRRLLHRAAGIGIAVEAREITDRKSTV